MSKGKLFVIGRTFEDINDLAEVCEANVIYNLHEDCLVLIEAIKKFESNPIGRYKQAMFDLVR